jgi:hypothetical protein
MLWPHPRVVAGLTWLVLPILWPLTIVKCGHKHQQQTSRALLSNQRSIFPEQRYFLSELLTK